MRPQEGLGAKLFSVLMPGKSRFRAHPYLIQCLRPSQGNPSLDIPFAVISYSTLATSNALDSIYTSAGTTSLRRSREMRS